MGLILLSGKDYSHSGLGDLGDLSSVTHVTTQNPTFCGAAVILFTRELQVDTAQPKLAFRAKRGWDGIG